SAKAATALLLFDSHVRHKRRDLELETVPRRRLQLQVECWRAERWERRWYRSVDALAAVSPVDADVTARLVGRSVEVVPNPVPDSFFSPPACSRSKAEIAFVGSLLYPPNLDAVRWLVREIWPAVTAKVPGAQLRIA